MIRPGHRYDLGLTGLELVIVISVIASFAAILLVCLGGSHSRDDGRIFSGGLIEESIYISGDNLQPVGNMYGFPSISRTIGTIPVVIMHEDPGRLGVVRLAVSLFIGDTGAIDMDHVRVQWDDGEDHEIIPRTISPALICPNWTISNKFNMLPGRTADSDELLEPGEQFELILCPRQGVSPYGKFTVEFRPEGVAMPLAVSRTVPFCIQPVMNLG